MRGQWRFSVGALVFALAVAAGPLEAQRGFGGRGAGFGDSAGPNLGNSVALAIEHQEDLELSGDQVAQLQELNTVLEGEIAGLVEEMNTLRSGIRSGELDRDEGFRQMNAVRGELITAFAPIRGRVQEILTVDQHKKLQPLVWEGRPGLGRGIGMGGAQGAPMRPRAGGAFQGGVYQRGSVIQPRLQGNFRAGRGGGAVRPVARGRAQAPLAGVQGRGLRSSRALRNPVPFRRGFGGDSPVATWEGGNLP
jgi:hypothetical protein